MTIVVAGGSGYIGTKLTQRLLGQGHTVIVVDIVAPRFTHEKLFYIQCDLSKQELPFNVLERTDAVINLVGLTIIKRWTEEYKKQIRDSRVESTRHLVNSIHGASSRPSILISASAVGFYGERDNEELTERSAVGTGFLADVAADWEYEALKAEQFGTRVVCIRTAPVLGSAGIIPILRKMSRFGFLLRLSKQDFWQPWIHEADVISVYLFALETITLQGVVNAVAPEPVTHQEFMKEFSRFTKRPVLGAVPLRVARLVYGELFVEMTKSMRIIPQRLNDKGFVFLYPSLTKALRDSIHEAK